MEQDQAEVGVFGGSGFYSFLRNIKPVSMHTPYGAPSAQLSLGTIEGRSVAFLPRHGSHHETPAHKVNYRANIWAMRELGVTRVIGPCAAGSLRPDHAPGDMVVLDQFVDRTNGRNDTYFDGGLPGHVSMADPYCPELSDGLADAASSCGVNVHRGATVVVVQGPRFSTRAESRWFRNQGWDTVNMTQYPEVALARELGMCYAGIALITDYDAGLEGVDGIEPVQMKQVFATLARNVERTREILVRAIPLIPDTRSCSCELSLDGGPLSRH